MLCIPVLGRFRSYNMVAPSKFPASAFSATSVFSAVPISEFRINRKTAMETIAEQTEDAEDAE